MDEFTEKFQELMREVCPGVRFVDCTPEPEEFDDCAWPNDEYGG